VGPVDLSRRALVVLAGVPAVVALLYFGGWILSVPVALLAAQGASETYDLVEAGGTRPFRWLGMIVAGSFVLAAASHPTFTGMAPWVLGIAMALTVVTVVAAAVTRWPGGRPLGAVATTLFGALYGGFALAFVPLLHALPARMGWQAAGPSPWAGVMVVALPLATMWLGDGAAYFVGTAWGRAKLAPRLSPAKSWAGAYGGLAASGVAGALWFLIARPYLPGLPVAGWWMAAGMGVVLGVVGQIGDLVESLLKREAGVKNSGNLFPGHGGVLDRTDSLVFALPTAYLLLTLAGLFG
jgi:phosphatidate cytidylyltransferase